MKSIKLTIMGRQFPLKVDEKNEKQMYEIATFVDNRIRTYKKELSNQAEPVIMILACLSIAEELFRAKEGIDDTDIAAVQRSSSTSEQVSADTSGINALLYEIIAELRQ
jgi:cell division protein ZapA